MKILVIDPNPLFLQAAHNFIGALPACECITATSLQAALDQDAWPADMALIDYSLRRAGGESAVLRLKALAPQARVVLMTPADAAAYRNSCLAAGADDCAAKDALGSEMPRLVSAREPALKKECA